MVAVGGERILLTLCQELTLKHDLNILFNTISLNINYLILNVIRTRTHTKIYIYSLVVRLSFCVRVHRTRL